MKKKTFLILVFFVFHPAILGAEQFLGAPLVPDGQTKLKTESRLEMISRLSHDEIVKYYKEALKGQEDIKFRNWEDATYIEDDGKQPWHSITISKPYKDGTTIIIVKDNWTWIIGTLFLRYIGVFMVLMVLFLGMSLSGYVISRGVKKFEEKKQ
ncbi:MAG: hypothetical protein ABII26_08360 [Pseudomonadota bacterium]